MSVFLKLVNITNVHLRVNKEPYLVALESIAAGLQRWLVSLVLIPMLHLRMTVLAGPLLLLRMLSPRRPCSPTQMRLSRLSRTLLAFLWRAEGSLRCMSRPLQLSLGRSHQVAYATLSNGHFPTFVRCPNFETSCAVSSVANKINNMVLPIRTPSQYYCIAKGCILYYPI
jgi:hypothetical protein